MCKAFALPLLIGVLAAATEAAAVTINQTNVSNNTSEVFYTPSAADLINQGQATFASQTSSGYAPFTNAGQTSSTAALNDGSAGTASNLNGVAFDLDGVWTSNFHLNATGANSAGFSIGQIQTIAGWSAGRSNQKFDLLYSTVSSNPNNDDTTGYTSLGTFTYEPNANNAGPSSTRVTLDITALTGVNALKFNIQVPAATNGSTQTVYREIDVFASAVPEPSGLALLCFAVLSLVGLMAHRRGR